MKTVSYFIIIILSLSIILISCRKPDDEPIDVIPDSTALAHQEIYRILTKYSWKVEKYVARLEDSSLYDLSDMFYEDECDKFVFTLGANKKYYHRSACSSTNYEEDYWTLNSDYTKILQSTDSLFRTVDNEYSIEQVAEDTLKFFFVDLVFYPDELFVGGIFYYIPIPKE